MTAVLPQEERLEWFRNARFGLFVHWGAYALLGRGEQVMYRDLIPKAEYEMLADRFHPAPDWAPRLARQAREAGCRYVALTTRHHDGYCLFETSTHDYNAAKTGPGRDLVREFVDAMRAEGLKIGFYYSVHTWRWHGFWEPGSYADELPQIVDEMHAQVEELMTHYGRIDVLWYDVSAVPGASPPGSHGYLRQPIEQTSAEFYRSAELNARVRQLQPHILINDRSGVEEDFGTPEQHITPAKGGRMWEACMTLNFAPGWGYLPHSLANKSFGEVVHYLMSAVRLGGNYLFNVGPDAKGYIAGEQAEILEQLTAWMKVHGEAVHDTHPEAIYGTPNQGPSYHYGMFTCKGSTAYFTIFYYPGSELILSRVGPGLRSAELLTTGQPLTVEPISNARWRISGLPETPPEPSPPVLKIEFEGPPHLLHYKGAAWLDGELVPAS